MKLTVLQTKVLNALKDVGSTEYTTYRKLADAVGSNHPFSVQQAVNSLWLKGLLIRDENDNFTPAPEDSKITVGSQYETTVPTAWLVELMEMINKLPGESSDLKLYVKSGRHFL